MFDYDHNNLPKSLSTLFVRHQFMTEIFVTQAKINSTQLNVLITDMVITLFLTTEQRSSIWQRTFRFTMIPHIRKRFKKNLKT